MDGPTYAYTQIYVRVCVCVCVCVCMPGWDVHKMDGPRGLGAWRAQEPINAHSHLLSMILGKNKIRKLKKCIKLRK